MGKSNIYVVAGGTGGHVIPARVVADRMHEAGQYVVFISDKRGLKFLKNVPYEVVSWNLSLLGRRRLVDFPMVFWQLLRHSFGVLSLFFQTKPSRVIGFGGYVTLAPLFLARLFFAKTFIHEQNAVMGRVNSILHRLVHGVFSTFPLGVGDIETGLPIRSDLIESFQKEFDGPNKIMNILVVGGSQGAQVFADAMPAMCEQLTPDERKKIVITQQARTEDCELLIKAYKHLNVRYRVLPFIDDMASALQDSSLVVCRGGASTISEVALAKRCALIVPYPYAAHDHQTLNAKLLVENGAGYLLAQSPKLYRQLLKHVRDYLNNPDAYAAMGLNAAQLARSDAAESICKYFLAEGR